MQNLDLTKIRFGGFGRYRFYGHARNVRGFKTASRFQRRNGQSRNTQGGAVRLRLCRGILQKIDVDCSVLCVDAPKYSEENKISLETAARVLRYEVLAKSDCDFVCLAHHADDNAETVLMHILRGSGAYGAQGIKRINGKYLRPLIDLTREEIERYARNNNVPFVVDSTNAETIYTRNLVRREVMPMLKNQLLRGQEFSTFCKQYRRR